MSAPAHGASECTPRVSVISIFLNEERFIREAIESVLSQTYSQFELILVDDGSSDASSTIARDYAAEYPSRIRLIEHQAHENRGMSASRNLGLQHARGEFVAFIDADDRWCPKKLAEQVALMDRMPRVDAVAGSVNYWSHESGRDRLVRTGHVRNRLIPAPEAAIRLYPLGRAHAPSMSDLLFRRHSIERAGGFEEAFTGAYEDQAFLAKFYLAGTLYITDRVWSDYRLHSHSCMAEVSAAGTYRQSRRLFLDWYQNYLAGTPHSENPQIRRALARAVGASSEDRGASSLRQKIRSAAPGFVVAAVRRSKRAIDELKPLLSPGPAILMYHRIADERFDPWGLAVSPERFSDQLAWIARNRMPVTLAEFADLHLAGKLPRDAVALTFDDGYACNAEVALPLLQGLGIPATIFLPAELIELGREFWWDELERIVLEHEGEHLRLDCHTIPLGEQSHADRQWAFGDLPRTARQSAYKQLWSILYERTSGALHAGMDQLRSQTRLSDAPRGSHRPITREQIHAAATHGLLEFGSHALTHSSLPRLSREEKAKEIQGSIERCAQLTGASPRTFAYPYGNMDEESAELVRDAGFLCACKAEGRFVRRRSDAFALPRIFVGNWTSAQLARQLGAK